MKYIKRNIFALILFCVLFVVAKIQHLTLPFFWDEAWPYSTGVFHMYSNGLSLLPGSVPFDISRGHPLFFHFISAIWMKIFGTSLMVIHLFPLLISILLIMCVYFFCIDFFSDAVALASCLLLMVQPVFFSQSAMLLPEIMVALLTLLSLWTFLHKKKLLYILFATLLLLTKESGMVIIIALFSWNIIEKIRQNKQQRFLRILAEGIYLLVPIAIAAIFFILQKIKTGYFFFPMYVSENNFKWAVFAEKLKNYFAYVFIYQGRNILSIVLILSIAVILMRKFKISPKHKQIIFPMIIFSALYLIFSSLSFYSPRYMLSILPFLTLISSYMLFTAAQRKRVIYFTSLTFIILASVFYCFRKKPVTDHSPGFADGVSVTQNAINWCEVKNMQDKKIYSSFLLQMHLTHPEHGYLSSDKRFNNVVNSFDSTVDVCIFPNYEYDESYNVLKQHGNFKLVKRFEKNYAWCEIYEIAN